MTVAALEIFVVRHGATEWNQLGRFQGQIDVPLSQEGRVQALALRDLLRDVEFDAIYSSDLKRAKETAELIAKGPVAEDPRWRELAMGKFEGQARDELDMPAFQRLLHRDSLEPECGVETLNAFEMRLISALGDLVAKHRDDKRVLLVAHGGVIRTLLERIVDNSAGLPKSYQNCQYVTVRVDECGPRAVDHGGLRVETATSEGGSHLG